MKTAVFGTVLVLSGFAAAQTSGLPSCAQACVTKFTSGSSIGSCGALDGKCICSNQSFLSDIACCLAGACSASDQAAAVTFAQQFCTTQGVQVPGAVVCASSSAAAGATSSSNTGAAVATGTSASSPTSALPASTTSTLSSASGSSAAAASASTAAAKNAGLKNGAGAGMSFVGGLAAALVLL